MTQFYYLRAFRQSNLVGAVVLCALSKVVDPHEQFAQFGGVLNFFDCEPGFAAPIRPLAGSAWNILGLGFLPEILEVD